MRLILTLMLFGLLIDGADAQDHSSRVPQQDNREYTRWIKRYRRRPKVLLDVYPKAQVWFTIWSVECEGKSPVSSSQTSCPSRTNVCQVSSTGLVACEYTAGRPVVRGSYGKLKREKFEQLNMLISRLPDDFEHLPPLGRRLVIQFRDEGRNEIRVYDEQQLPEAVKDIVDLVGLNIVPLQQESPAPQ